MPYATYIMHLASVFSFAAFIVQSVTTPVWYIHMSARPAVMILLLHHGVGYIHMSARPAVMIPLLYTIESVIFTCQRGLS